MHLIVAELLGGYLRKDKSESWFQYFSKTIKKSEKGHYVVLLNIRGLNKDWKLKLVAMAPLLVPFIFTVLTLMNFNFIFVLGYLALFYKTALPSPSDFNICGWECPKFLHV